MRSFVLVCTSSALFGIAIATVYGFVAHAEAAGMVLLGTMAVALAFATLYAVFAEKDANLEGDRRDESPPQWAGDDLGIFTPRSAWPILTAACAALFLLALLWSQTVAVLAIVALVLCLWRLGAESARHG